MEGFVPGSPFQGFCSKVGRLHCFGSKGRQNIWVTGACDGDDWSHGGQEAKRVQEGRAGEQVTFFKDMCDFEDP